MPGEDQERFEDYLELERYIEELQAGRVAHPPHNLTPTQARVYRTAALFRSASPDAATPRPEFAEALRNRLLALDQENDQDDTEKRAAVTLKNTEEPVPPELPAEEPLPVPEEVPQAPEPPVETEIPVPPRTPIPRRKSAFSRRSILTGSAVAAASLVVGGGIGAIAERSATTPSPPPAATPTQGNYGGTPLVQDGVWHFVTTLDQIGDDALRFSTDTINGYLMRSDGDEGEKKGEVIAFSAACTHMGCIVQWDGSDHQFHCPCHGGVFTEYGKPSPTSAFKYLASLPRMTTQVRGNEVYVLVPKSSK